jgi:DNA primase
MATQWVDFKALREQVPIADVLKHYGVTLKIKGEQASGLCPLPDHPARSHGKRTASFSVNLAKGIWQCFGCKASGNQIDLVTRLEGLDPGSGKDVRAAALKLAETFGIKTPPPESGGKDPKPKSKQSRERVAKPAARPVESENVLVNVPLDFELRQLDAEHPYLVGRGLDGETIRQFGLGYCGRGMLKNRIAIPLHSATHELVGYAGRIVDDDAIDDDNPKYRFPSRRERDGKVIEFRKSELLYNASRIVTAPVKFLIVVEGFASVWHLTQQGLPRVVALMGSSCSEKQAELIVSLTTPDAIVCLMPDGDAGGHSVVDSFFSLVGRYRACRWIKLDAEKQPTDYPAEELHALMPSGRVH